jgi:hypothetical protein
MDPLDPLRDSLEVQCQVCGEVFNVTMKMHRRCSYSPSPACGRGLGVREPVMARTLSCSGVATIAMTG